MRKLFLMAGLATLLALTACEAESGGEGVDDGSGEQVAPPKTDETDGKLVAKSDQWNYANDPSRFQVQLNYKFDELKTYTTGVAAQLPWPSDYWSYVADSTNVRFHGKNQLSPVEKYDAAFNGWTPNLELTPLDPSVDCVDGAIADKHTAYYDHLGPAAKWQSYNKGNYDMRDGRDSDGDGKTDECDSDGYDGIEGWWGLCHAWTPAAILEPEPLHDVTYKGQTFTVSDIKALLITMYDQNRALMLGTRCNDKDVKRDDLGRVLSDTCRDTNAGAWHVVAVNMLGVQQRAFAEDRTYDYQVWNQPVYKYAIHEQTELTEEQALQKLGAPAGSDYQTKYNSPNATAFVYVRMTSYYVRESRNTVEGALTPNLGSYTGTDDYEYVLELDANRNIVGGEWINYSRTSHPDFLWLPLSSAGGNPNISMANIRTLLELSRQTAQPPVDPNLQIRSYGGETVDIAIPDNDAVGIARTITVADDVTIAKLTVDVEIRHTYIGDLKVTLVRSGQSVVLHDNAGGSQHDLVRSFDVANFDGTSAKGDWELQIVDSAGQDTGKLVKWSLGVANAAPATVTTRRVSKTSTAKKNIPDNNPGGVWSNAINMTDTGVVTALEVVVDVTHPYVGDLEVTLVKDSNKVVLHAREGGSADDIKKTFTVDGFGGATVKGAWKLFIADHAGGDVGKLNKWTLRATVR